MKLGIDAIARLRDNFDVRSNRSTLESLQHDCRMLVGLIQQLIDETPQVDWLEDANLDYDLSTYSREEMDAFKDIQKLALQQELDNSTEGKGYTIVKFDLVPVTGTNRSRASAFLSPAARKNGGHPGGGNGTVNPGYPPR